MSVTPDQIAASHRAIGTIHKTLVGQIQRWVIEHADDLSATFEGGDAPRLSASGALYTREEEYGVELTLEKDEHNKFTQRLTLHGTNRKVYRIDIESGPRTTEILKSLQGLSTGFGFNSIVAPAFTERFMFKDQGAPAFVSDNWGETTMSPSDASKILEDTITVTPTNPNVPNLGQLLRRRIGTELLQLE